MLTCADGELRRVSAAPATRCLLQGDRQSRSRTKNSPSVPICDRLAPCGSPCTGGATFQFT